jgi:protein-disulfide isomerase
MKNFFLVLLIIIVLVILLWLVTLDFSDTSPVANLNVTTNTSQADEYLSISETDPFKGRREAPVTLIIVSSFACPTCKSAAVLMDQLLALYPQDLKIVRKDLPESLDESYQAAIAARCAQQQGRYWQYHDLLFNKQDLLSTRTLYSLWARELGMQVEEFEVCFNEEKTSKLVNRNIDESIRAGVNAVPYFQLDNTDVLEGIQSLATFRGLIDDVLDEF